MQWLLPIRRRTYEGADGFGRLLADSEADAKYVSLVPITSTAELLIHPTAFKTVAGYRFNVAACRQISSLVCGGLPTVLFSLLPNTPSPTPEAELGLLRIYNQAVKLAGANAVGFKLVVDKRGGHVVGVVGRTYKFVSNAEVLRLAARYFKQAQPGYVLMKAELNNRELSLLASRRGASVNSDGVSFKQGLALYNSETTKRAIFAPQVLFDSLTKSYSYEPESSANRMIHRRKKQFAVQLESLVTAAFQAGSFLETAANRHQELVKMPLSPVDKREAALHSISRRLLSRKLNALPVERVIASLGLIREPTRWDVYRAMVAVAGEFRSTERQLRMAAFRFLYKGEL